VRLFKFNADDIAKNGFDLTSRGHVSFAKSIASWSQQVYAIDKPNIQNINAIKKASLKKGRVPPQVEDAIKARAAANRRTFMQQRRMPSQRMAVGTAQQARKSTTVPSQSHSQNNAQANTVREVVPLNKRIDTPAKIASLTETGAEDSLAAVSLRRQHDRVASV
jgi:hypothetical protein